nr:hypothetical protein [uncultured Flavobacterium sp.]
MKFYFTIILIFVICNNTVGQSDVSEKLFKTNTDSKIIQSEPIDLDFYNDLIIIPEGKMYKKFFERINYFKEVMNFKEFEKYAATKVDQSLYEGTKNIDEVFKAIFDKHRHFFIFTEKHDKTNKTVQLILTKPGAEVLFIVEGNFKTNVVGITAGTLTITENTYNSMMNEFVNYIRLNAKAY